MDQNTMDNIVKATNITRACNDNTRLIPFAMELLNQNHDEWYIEQFFTYWDNMDERSGEWKDTADYIYDGNTEFNMDNIHDEYHTWLTHIFPDTVDDMRKQLHQTRHDLRHVCNIILGDSLTLDEMKVIANKLNR